MFMTKKIFKYSLSVIFLSMGLVLITATVDFTTINQAKAATMWDTVSEGGLKQVGTTAYGKSNPDDPNYDIRAMIVRIIKVLLGFLGIIATVIILFAGFKWMTAGGNEEKVSEAKKMLIAGLIGLFIILFSYALATFVLKYMSAAATGTQVIW